MCAFARAPVCMYAWERERDEIASDTRMQRGVTISSGGPHGMHRAESKTTQGAPVVEQRERERRNEEEKNETAKEKKMETATLEL